MENLSNSLFLDAVPESWQRRAYPSLHGLTQWYADLLQRIKELESWISDFVLPNAVWLGGFFNPQSFLTAIMQQMARKNEWPLDKMALQCDVTKKNKEDMGGPPREGAYVHGLYMEGARWDLQTGNLCPSFLSLYLSLYLYLVWTSRQVTLKMGHISPLPSLSRSLSLSFLFSSRLFLAQPFLSLP